MLSDSEQLAIKLTFYSSIELPDQVSNLTVTDITSMSVKLSWQDKTRSRYYIVNCIGCPQKDIFPIERKSESVTLESLSPSTTYNISIAVSNNITEITGVLNHTFAVFTTDPGSKKSLLRLS